jgi:apolipoprotein D and lipocalin family protein
MTELRTVEHVDVARYMGTWYEIARISQGFEKGLVGITANYTLLPNGKVRVLNKGYVKNFDGRERLVTGTAWVTDTTTNAKLKVSFFWPFSAEYWIIELGENYEYAMVGNSSRRYLWILSRTAQMDGDTYQRLVESARAKGFEVGRIERSIQR